MCNILLGLRVCVCVVRVFLLTRMMILFGICGALHAILTSNHTYSFVQYGYSLSHFPSVTVSEFRMRASERTSKYISYFKLKHTAVCASMCCSIIAWISTVCSAQKQILGTLYSTQHSLLLSHSLAVYCTVCIHHTHV